MRKHQQLGYLLILVLVCGSVALAATQWTMQPKESKLTFVGTQAGAEFEGAFERSRPTSSSIRRTSPAAAST